MRNYRGAREFLPEEAGQQRNELEQRVLCGRMERKAATREYIGALSVKNYISIVSSKASCYGEDN